MLAQSSQKVPRTKSLGTEITHFRRPRPKPVPDHLVPSTPSLTDSRPYGLPTSAPSCRVKSIGRKSMSALRSRAESPVRIHLLRKRKQTGRDTVVTYAFVEEVRLDAGRGDQRAKDFAQGSSARAVQLLRRSPRRTSASACHAQAARRRTTRRRLPRAVLPAHASSRP